MAEDTSIFHEIDEALRADKAAQFWARNSSTIILFCVLLVLSSAASSFWKSHLREVHEKQSAKLAQGIILLDAGRASEAADAFRGAEQDGGPLAAAATIKEAQALVANHEPDKAIAVYNGLASGKQEAPDLLRDYAALQADILAHNQALATGKPAVATQGGKEARAAGRPFASAFSQLDALRASDPKTAGTLLTAAIDDKDAPLTERLRAAQLMEFIAERAK